MCQVAVDVHAALLIAWTILPIVFLALKMQHFIPSFDENNSVCCHARLWTFSVSKFLPCLPGLYNVSAELSFCHIHKMFKRRDVLTSDCLYLWCLICVVSIFSFKLQLNKILQLETICANKVLVKIDLIAIFIHFSLSDHKSYKEYQSEDRFTYNSDEIGLAVSSITLQIWTNKT